MLRLSPTWKGRVPILQLTAGAILISFSPVFVTLAQVGPTTAAFYRMLFGAAILLFLVVIRRQRLPNARNSLWIVLVCGVLFALDLTFFHQSIRYVGAGLSTLLGNFQVFFLAAFGLLFLHERLTWRYVFSFVLAVLGVVLIVGLDWQALSPEFKVGVWLALAGALAYAAYLLLLRRLQGQREAPSALGSLAVISLVTFPILGLESFLQGQSLSIPDLPTGGILAAYALCSQVLGWWLISRALPQVPASRAGLVLLLQPALAFVWEVLFFAGRFSLLQGAGALLAMVAIYLGASEKRRG